METLLEVKLNVGKFKVNMKSHHAAYFWECAWEPPTTSNYLTWAPST